MSAAPDAVIIRDVGGLVTGTCLDYRPRYDVSPYAKSLRCAQTTQSVRASLCDRVLDVSAVIQANCRPLRLWVCLGHWSPFELQTIEIRAHAQHTFDVAFTDLYRYDNNE
jgi:hypothetical protein